MAEENLTLFQRCERLDTLRSALSDIEKRLFNGKLLASLPNALKCQAYRLASRHYQQSIELLHSYRRGVFKLNDKLIQKE